MEVFTFKFGLMSLIILFLFSFQGTKQTERFTSLKTEPNNRVCLGLHDVGHADVATGRGELNRFPFYILRKEVIQPHLPIRLPCYDFTPIIGPTFGGWLLNRIPHRLPVLPTLVVGRAAVTRHGNVLSDAICSRI